jgi:hypothetical protein
LLLTNADVFGSGRSAAAFYLERSQQNARRQQPFMILRRPRTALSVALLVASNAVAQSPRPDGILRFATGDSVEVVQSGPLRLATGETGLAFKYHPFVAVKESPRLKAVATQLWRWLKPQLDGNPPPFVVLMATTARAHPATGVSTSNEFNYVLERRKDGKWYFGNDSLPAH